MQTEINFYPYPVYVGASQTLTMNIHRLALAKWLLTESADKANHGLKTVDKAAAEDDKEEEVTPDAIG